MNRHLKLAILPLLGLVPCLSQAQTVTRGPYLQNGSTTATTVRWRTSTATDSVVKYGTSITDLNLTATDAASVTEHEIRLTGLTPNTTYYYTIGYGTTSLSSGFVVTAPTSAKPTRVWVMGDAGTGTSVQTAVRDAYYNYSASRHTDLWLMLGDNAYNSGTDAENTANLFNIYPAMLKKSVLWTTMGNHETGSSDSPTQTGPYYAQHTLPKQGEAGGIASGTEAYYAFDYGNIHFICLDSADTSLSATGAMANWVRSDLQNNTKDWTVVFFHHPPYTKGSHNSDSESQLVSMRTNFNPIFEDYGVDLVLCGHSHSYERSKFIDGHYGLSTTFSDATMVKQAGSGQGAGAYTKSAVGPVAHEGTVYAVPGSSGQTSGGTLNHPAMWISLNVAGSMVLDINNNRLDAIFLDNVGATRDSFSMIKGTTPNVLPNVLISYPTSGATYTAPATVDIDAIASDSDGSVTKVDFYQGATLIGTDSTSPHTFRWSNVPAGTYSLTAVATDNVGGTKTSAPVSIVVNSPANVAPTATITNPVNASGFNAPATITIDAGAADSDGSVTKVDFYQGTTLIGTDTTSPYSFTWNNVPAGAYNLTAIATDNGGATGTSSVVSVSVDNTNSDAMVVLQNGTNGYNGMIDTYIVSKPAKSNFGTATTLLSDGSPDTSTLLRWDLSSIPSTATVTSVSLVFNVTDVSAQIFEIYSLRRAWSESGATWNQASAGVNWGNPGAKNTSTDRENTVLGTMTSSTTGTLTVNLNAAGIAKVQGWINGSVVNNGFIIQDYNTTDGLDVSSSEAATVSQRPAIRITYH